MNRKSIRIGLGLPILAIALSLMVHQAFRTGKQPPNILLITIDTLRADHLSCYGYAKKTSPNLDRLAAEGILFQNAFSVMPETIPAHGSIFFGTWPRIHGSLGNDYNFSNHELAFLPRLLQAAGYNTAAFVSRFHLARAMEKVPGFVVFRAPLSRGEQRADVALRQARHWLKKRPDKFFVWIHLWDPHSPYLLHPEFMQKINPGFRDNFKTHYGFFPRGSVSRETLSRTVDLYDNEICYVDSRLGAFLDRLKAASVLDNTIVVVTSDHGETLDELAATDNYAFAHGEFLYDSQLHVPLIVLLPKKQKKGARIKRVVTLLDIMPTILECTALPVPESVKGSSLVRDDSSSSLIFLQRRRYLDVRMPAHFSENEFGVRENKFKLIYDMPSGRMALHRNSREGVPVAGEEQMKNFLARKLKMWISLTAKEAPKTLDPVSQDAAEELRALGYVQ